MAFLVGIYKYPVTFDCAFVTCFMLFSDMVNLARFNWFLQFVYVLCCYTTVPSSRNGWALAIMFNLAPLCMYRSQSKIILFSGFLCCAHSCLSFNVWYISQAASFSRSHRTSFAISESFEAAYAVFFFFIVEGLTDKVPDGGCLDRNHTTSYF